MRSALAGRPGWALAADALGDAELRAGDAKAAEKAFRDAIKASPKAARGHAGLGRALLAQGKLQAAEKALGKALELVPNSAPANMALAEVYAKTERIGEAIEQYKRAFDVNPRDPSGLLRGAKLALDEGRRNLASAYLDRLLKVHRESAAAFALYGDVMLSRGTKVKAREYYLRALGGKGEFDRKRVEQALAEL